MRSILILIITLTFLTLACSGNEEISSARQDQGMIENDAINEASGIDAGHLNTKILWTHNDSGDLSRIFALDTKGKNLLTVVLEGITARDWEDIAVGPGPEAGKSYIYIADIGDNRAQYEDKYIYRIPEPDLSLLNETDEMVVNQVEIIHFRYPDGMRDAETLMIDPVTKDLIIVSKREENVNVYRLSYPQKTDEILIPEKVATLPYTQICGGDISDSGSKIILKNYDNIFYWPRLEGQSIGEAMSRETEILEYTPEPQGEAVCWSSDERGYYTLSEEADDIPAHLYFYVF